MMLKHKVNVYNSVEVVDPCTHGDARGAPITATEFETVLFQSLQQWKKEKRKGVWLKIGIEMSDLIPVAVRAGFVFHRAEADHVMLTAWLTHEHENKLPPGPSHFIGVAGFVVNSKNQVLCIKEKSGPSARLQDFWKLPGGLVDTHEDLKDAVVREVKEETGIDTEFVCIATMQEIHHSQEFGGHARAGTTDMYCICVLRLLDETQPIKIQEEEIAAAKWLDIEEFLNIRYYAQSGTVYHEMFQSAARVSRDPSSGLTGQHLPFGIVKGSNTLYFSKSKL